MLAVLAAGAISAAVASSAQAGVEVCYWVSPHSGRQSPAAAYALHVYDAHTGLPLYLAYTNIEGWYYTRRYPNGHLAKVLWHQHPWISNYSDVLVRACFFVPR